MRGASTVLGGVCADLPQKCGKAALSYSTPSVTQICKQATGNLIFTPTGVYRDKEVYSMAASSEIVDIVRGMSISLAELPLVLQQLREGTSGQSVQKSEPAEKEENEI